MIYVNSCSRIDDLGWTARLSVLRLPYVATALFTWLPFTFDARDGLYELVPRIYKLDQYQICILHGQGRRLK